ncbi:MAG: hypothetical protein ACRC2U_06660, partial [Aeromonas sp.]
DDGDTFRDLVFTPSGGASGNLIVGEGPPSEEVGVQGSYYLQKGVTITGAFQIWGPKNEDGWPGQADFMPFWPDNVYRESALLGPDTKEVLQDGALLPFFEDENGVSEQAVLHGDQDSPIVGAAAYGAFRGNRILFAVEAGVPGDVFDVTMAHRYAGNRPAISMLGPNDAFRVALNGPDADSNDPNTTVVLSGDWAMITRRYTLTVEQELLSVEITLFGEPQGTIGQPDPPFSTMAYSGPFVEKVTLGQPTAPDTFHYRGERLAKFSDLDGLDSDDPRLTGAIELATDGQLLGVKVESDHNGVSVRTLAAFDPISIDAANLIAGLGVPSNTLGIDGDYYQQLDAAVGDFTVYGPKTGGQWGEAKALRQPAPTPVGTLEILKAGTSKTASIWAAKTLTDWLTDVINPIRLTTEGLRTDVDSLRADFDAIGLSKIIKKDRGPTNADLDGAGKEWWDTTWGEKAPATWDGISNNGVWNVKNEVKLTAIRVYSRRNTANSVYGFLGVQLIKGNG